MKKITISLLLLFFTFLFASETPLDISYPSDQVIKIRFNAGNLKTNTWIEDGNEIRRYTFEHSNYLETKDDKQFGMLTIPVAIGKVLPSVKVNVLNSTAFDHPASNQELYRIGPVETYRDQRFVTVVVNPFFDDARIADELEIIIDLHDVPAISSDTEQSPSFINQNYLETMRTASFSKYALKKQTSFNGEWLEIVTSEDGIYSIRRSDLVNAGIQGDIDDTKLYVFAGPGFGGQLRTIYPDTVDLHLKQIPLLFLDAANDDEDKWVFYASPNSYWVRQTAETDLEKVRFNRNSYEDDQHFKLFVGTSNESPLRMEQRSQNFNGTEIEQAYTYQRRHLEEELINPAKGGELWFGERFSSTNQYSFYLDNLYRNSQVNGALRFSYGITTVGNHEFTTLVGDSTINTSRDYIGTVANDIPYESSLVSRGGIILPNSMLSEDFEVTVNYKGANTTSEAFLDYLDILYPSTLDAIDGQLGLWFLQNDNDRKVHVTGLTGTVSYIFSTEDPFSVNYFPVSGESADILIPASNYSTSYLVVNESHFRTPESILIQQDFDPLVSSDHESQVDLIIITADAFLSEANRLANFKETRENNPLSTRVKGYREIVDQYNAGNRDPYAIWQFIADMYNQCPGEKPKYVLLIGDGHYDYQNRLFDMPVWVPYLYESGVLWPNDDIYTMINSADDAVNDLALGRIPANSVSEVKAVVDKIIDYDERRYTGEWQLNAMLIADDPSDEPQGRSFLGHTMFIEDSETLNNQYLPKVMQVKKVYLTEYPERYITELQTMGRDGARDDIMEAFLNGVSFVNFYGHGDPSVWTQEKVFVSNDLVRLDVNHHYPIIIAATCSWGRSDNPDFQSMAEEIMLMEENGAISTLATVRSVLHGPNVSFVEEFMKGLFQGRPEYSYTPLIGDALLHAKIIQGGARNYNNRKFFYFGDPTINPMFPQNAGQIDSVSRDTLRALDKVSISGKAFDRSGSVPLETGLNGKITVYDNDYRVTRPYTNSSWGTSNISYYLKGNRLFNGSISFDGNAFSTDVFIPKDIQYHGTNGKIRMIYWNEDGYYDGSAAIDDIHVGGINPEAEADILGPDISILKDEDELQNGAVVFDTSDLKIVFEDASGINITGMTGHVLEMTVDNGQHVIDLSELFSYDKNDYSRGEVNFSVNDYLDEGEHLLEIAAFDNYNNYSNIELTVSVLNAEDDIIQHLVNFPNPFKGSTDITFSSAFSGIADLRVYTISGKAVANRSAIGIETGFNRIPFDAEDNYGHPLAAGIYFYVLEIDTGNETLKQHSKMVVLP